MDTSPALSLPLELLELLHEEWPKTRTAIGPLSSSSLAQYRSLLFGDPDPANRHRLAALLLLAHEHISSQPYAAVPTSSRRFFTEVGLLWSLSDCLTPDGRPAGDWEEAVARLDRVLIVAGAPERVDLVLVLIEHIQHTHLPPLPLPSDAAETPPSSPPTKRARLSSLAPAAALSLAPNAIPRLSTPPSLSAYLRSHLETPFIVPGYLAATGWPAVVDPARRWKDGAYLLRAGGRGRVVPVEVDAAHGSGGGGYTDEGWGQALLPWDEFLQRAGFLPSSAPTTSPASPRSVADVSPPPPPPPPPLYLAQHDLFFQFPALARDVLTPDYVYACPPSTSTSAYQPPATASGVVTNVWVGDAGRGSPAHTDPFYNCFAQVVGRKRVLLVPPHHHAAMYPFASGPSSTASDGYGPRDDAAAEASDGSATALMSNTSRVPLLQASPPAKDAFPRFFAEALPDALEGVLDEGDLLVLPPGWWHAMRMEGGPGWGCSFWY